MLDLAQALSRLVEPSVSALSHIKRGPRLASKRPPQAAAADSSDPDCRWRRQRRLLECCRRRSVRGQERRPRVACWKHGNSRPKGGVPLCCRRPKEAALVRRRWPPLAVECQGHVRVCGHSVWRRACAYARLRTSLGRAGWAGPRGPEWASRGPPYPAARRRSRRLVDLALGDLRRSGVRRS